MVEVQYAMRINLAYLKVGFLAMSKFSVFGVKMIWQVLILAILYMKIFMFLC